MNENLTNTRHFLWMIAERDGEREGRGDEWEDGRKREENDRKEKARGVSEKGKKGDESRQTGISGEGGERSGGGRRKKRDGLEWKGDYVAVWRRHGRESYGGRKHCKSVLDEL